jgi:hypothetical protein
VFPGRAGWSVPPGHDAAVNGRVMTDDVYSLRFAWLTNGKVPPSGLKPHDDLLTQLPYTGPPNP